MDTVSGYNPGRWAWEDCRLNVYLGYRASSRSAWETGKTFYEGWDHNSVVEYLLTMRKVLGLIPIPKSKQTAHSE